MRVFHNQKEIDKAIEDGFRFLPEHGPASFICSECKKEKPVDLKGITTGYAHDNQGNLTCFECCGKKDKEEMLREGKLQGYLVQDGNSYAFTNWPGTLRIRVIYYKYSFHNFAGKNGRTDFWFTFEGSTWHGVQIGQNNQIARVKRIKG